MKKSGYLCYNLNKLKENYIVYSMENFMLIQIIGKVY